MVVSHSGRVPSEFPRFARVSSGHSFFAKVASTIPHFAREACIFPNWARINSGSPQPTKMAYFAFGLILSNLMIRGEAMNLDESRAVELRGPANSSFGYSVALWTKAPSKYSPLVVGSPRWANPMGLEGGIFFCDPINGRCWAGPALLAGPDSRVLESVNPDYRSDRGLGENLQSAAWSDHLLACAPRYPLEQTIKRFYGILARGGCTLLGPGRVEDIIPVTELTFVIQGATRKELRPNSIRFNGFSVSGFSSVMKQDGDQIFIGAPMAYFGQGTVYRKTLGQPGVVESRQSRNSHHDFMTESWAMAVGRLDGSSDILATSAPRADDLRGQVFLYSTEGEHLTPRRPRAGAALKGTEVGAVFGYSLAAGDWDGDGVEDLAVGAPYSVAQQIGATRDAVDAGAVHVVYGPLAESVERAGQVLSWGTDGGHYGLSLLCPGDLNLDSYADLVVGAPDDGEGKVFIYNGSPEGLETRPSQVLKGSSFFTPGAAQGGRFGFSLSGGHDIDGNGCPDLLVGAVEASQALFVRSAPVLTLVGEMALHPSVVMLGNNTCQVASGRGAAVDEYTCFDLHIDLRYNSTVFNETINTELIVTVDERYPFQRTVFMDTHQKSRILTRRISHVSGDPDPFTLKVYIKSERPSMSELVHATLQVKMKPFTPPLPSATIPPILQAPPLKAVTRLTCNDVTQCYSSSDLKLSIQKSPLVIGGERCSVGVSVRVLAARAHQVSLLVHLPRLLSFSHATSSHLLPHCLPLAASSPTDSSSLTLSCSIANTLNKDAQLELTFYLEYSALTLLQAHLQDPTLSLPIGFNISSDTQDLNPRDNTASVLLKPTTQYDVLLAGFTQTEQVRALINNTLKLSEVIKIKPDNNSLDVAVLGPIVSHSYTLRNRGPTPLLRDELIVSWPLSSALGEGLTIPVLYLTHSITVSGPITCDQPPINSLNFTLLPPKEPSSSRDPSGQDDIVMDYYNSTESPDTTTAGDESSRVRRSVPASESDGGGQTSVPAIDCDLIPCYTIRCSVPMLSAGEEATVLLQSRLVVASVHSRHRTMVVSSRATLASTATVTAVDSYVTLIAPPRGTLGLLSGQWWLLSIALLVGLFLLLLLAICLYKCGFFRRDKKKRTEQLRASQRHRHQPADRQLSKAEEQVQQQQYVQEQLSKQQQSSEDEDLSNQEPLLFDQAPPQNQDQLMFEQAAQQTNFGDMNQPQRPTNV